MRTLSVSTLILAVFLFTACAKKPARVFVPPPPPKQQPIPESPALVSPAPVLAAQQTELPPPGIFDHMYPAPEPWEIRRRRRPVAIQPSITPQQAQQPPVSPSPAQPLRLGAMLTPEQTQRLTQEISGSMSRTRRNLDAALRHNLNTNQKESAGQVRVFLKQAQAAQASDLEAARSLAERAEILSRDLLQSLR